MTEKRPPPQPQQSIAWTKPMLERIKKDYQRHVQAGTTEFTFDGHLFATAYVKYLIEYLEGKLK